MPPYEEDVVPGKSLTINRFKGSLKSFTSGVFVPQKHMIITSIVHLKKYSKIQKLFKMLLYLGDVVPDCLFCEFGD